MGGEDPAQAGSPRPLSTYQPVTPGAPYQRLIHAGNSPLRFLEVERIELGPTATWTRPADGRECVLVPLEGRAEVSVGPAGAAPLVRAEFERRDVFADPPPAVVVPPSQTVTVRGVALFTAIAVSASPVGAARPDRPGAAPVNAPRPITVIAEADVSVRRVGAGNWEREVRTIVGPGGPAERLIVGETINPPGHWSGMPPHKHDQAGPAEAPLEEIYYFRLTPSDGYLMQLLYDRRGAETVHLIRGESVVAIARGYHPTVAAPGTTGYYLWALAGPEKRYEVSIDPAFAWMQSPVRS